MNGTEFVEKYGVGFDWEATGYQRDADGWEHHAYRVTLTRDGRAETFDWRQGLAVDDEPQAGRVLEALAQEYHDATIFDDFEEWAGEMGYDTDSRKAYALWQLLDAQAAKLQQLFGDVVDAFADVQEG